MPLLRPLLFTALAALPTVSCDGFDPFRTTFDDVEPAVIYRAANQQPVAATPPRQLKVMTWNMKFGGGRVDFFFDCHGDRSQISEAEVMAHMEAIAEKVRLYDPDILLVQELDVLAKRTAYVDQLQVLLDKTDLNHAAYASQWRADLIPQDGVGRVDSGNAILSRYPLAEATRYSLAEITEFWFAKNYFWLRRNALRARVAVPGIDGLYAVDVHAAAFSKDGTKKKHIDRFKALMDEVVADGGQVVGGGDLNALPPRTDKISDFPDSACPPDGEFDADSYASETDWLDDLYADYTAAIPLDDYEADNSPHFTHTTKSDGFWNRKLDYLFTNLAVVPGSGLTHQDEGSGGLPTMPLSDHAPVSFVVEVQP